jgi:flagellar biosynthetic protein FlhB
MSWIAYFIIQMDFLTIIETGEISVAESLKILGFLGFKLTMIIAIILLIISVPDYFFQRYEFTESIKMTKQEIKEEYRESEGDPQVKQRQRQLAMELVRRSMMAEVRKADVVITNPTHFAVALRYDLTRENAPRVVAKGEDQIALIIRNIAKKEEIPVIENKPLAREIYRLVDVGDLVPVEFYDALAGIFITLSKYKTRLKNLSAGVGDA